MHRQTRVSSLSTTFLPTHLSFLCCSAALFSPNPITSSDSLLTFPKAKLINYRVPLCGQRRSFFPRMMTVSYLERGWKGAPGAWMEMLLRWRESRPMSSERKPPLACRERPLNHEIRGKAEREGERHKSAHYVEEKLNKKKNMINLFRFLCGLLLNCRWT